jgi:hypothetical protein
MTTWNGITHFWGWGTELWLAKLWELSSGIMKDAYWLSSADRKPSMLPDSDAQNIAVCTLRKTVNLQHDNA